MDEQVNHDHVYAAIKKAGYVKLVAHYSGGNDEGGAEEVTAYRAKRAMGFNTVVASGVDEDSPAEFSDWDHPMVKLVNNVLSEKYGTWAGEFEAYGDITIDAEAGMIEMVGQETAWQDSNEVWS